MKVSANQILPTQEFLKPDTVKYILECIKTNRLDDLPPQPIVRKDSKGKLIAIDGHNLIAVKAFQGEDINIHLAESPQDGIQGNTEPIKLRNKDLLKRYDSALQDRKKLQTLNINSFSDLISKYKDLFANH